MKYDHLTLMFSDVKARLTDEINAIERVGNIEGSEIETEKEKENIMCTMTVICECRFSMKKKSVMNNEKKIK